jgi:hypothetical protein
LSKRRKDVIPEGFVATRYRVRPSERRLGLQTGSPARKDDVIEVESPAEPAAGTAPASDRRAYANAGEILPVEILRIVQCHFDGGLLWVPPRASRREKTRGHEERNRQILEEKAGGASTKVLARKYGLSDARIRQLVRRPKTST